eukprot:TRINITY_DN54566_c0_g1_i2.p1 TRINITY_DN54566_c0_g1~~TRINITY_DN54566_c0_g1_i2.p1  ORF type:complete len:244 (-),score=62.20 TRINITY_DN54566_c0_g1_i2:129-860(-)
MGGVQSAVKDALGFASPWNSIVHVKNNTQTLVSVLLAHDPVEPRHDDALLYEVPPKETLAISSGYLNDPRATVIIRTGVDEARVFHVPNAGRLMVSLAPHGLKVESTDVIQEEPYPHPRAVPAHDTFPMALRGESFHDHPERSAASATSVSADAAAGDGQAEVALEVKNVGHSVLLGRESAAAAGGEAPAAQKPSVIGAGIGDEELMVGHGAALTEKDAAALNPSLHHRHHHARLDAPYGLEQ